MIKVSENPLGPAGNGIVSSSLAAPDAATSPNPWEALVQSLRCQCERSDAWRCAVARNLRSIGCHCRCHRYLEVR
jgi:hypothetical protein